MEAPPPSCRGAAFPYFSNGLARFGPSEQQGFSFSYGFNRIKFKFVETSKNSYKLRLDLDFCQIKPD
jgi:hypothetical protein